MQLELVEIIERVGVTCVMVTHDQEEAMTMAERIAIMHLGCIEQIGSPKDIYETPVSRQVCEFIGNVNLFDGLLVADEQDLPSSPVRIWSNPSMWVTASALAPRTRKSPTLCAPRSC